MATNRQIIIAFDAYGTLLSTESIAKQLATHVGEEKAQAIAAKWRLYQLEYTWRLNSMEQYEPFSTVTRHALQHALKEADIDLSQDNVDDLMKSYDSLKTFPDVSPALEGIKRESNVTAVVFSNGDQAMIHNSVHKSPDLSPYADVFKDLVLVSETKKYKPAPSVYLHLAQKVGKTKDQMGEMWLVSGNPFDVVGANAAGMKTAWVDRGGNGWTDCLVEGSAGRPTVIVRSLEEVLAAVKRST